MMENIEFKILRKMSKSENADIDLCNTSENLVKIVDNVLGNLKEKIGEMSIKESCDIAISLQNWVLKKDKIIEHDIHIGDIFLVDLGINYKIENAYVHPVLVLDIIGKYIFVVPTSSTDKLVDEAYHPIDNKDGNKYMRRVYGNNTEKSDGFECTCVLCLSNISTISQGRILKKKSKLNNLKLLDDIKQQIIEIAFSKYHIENIKLNADLNKYQEQISYIHEEINNLKNNIDRFKL